MRQLKIQKSITNRSSEALDKYLVEIGRAPLISIDEEIELAQKIKKGGPEGERAKDKLVTANLRFVVSVAKQYQHQGLTLTDLIDEGNIGLIKAAQKFDETAVQSVTLRPMRFVTFKNGRKFFEGCVLPSGFTVSKIDLNKIILTRDKEVKELTLK